MEARSTDRTRAINAQEFEDLWRVVASTDILADTELGVSSDHRSTYARADAANHTSTKEKEAAAAIVSRTEVAGALLPPLSTDDIARLIAKTAPTAAVTTDITNNNNNNKVKTSSRRGAAARGDLTQRQLEMRRKRNRASTERVRQRKLVEDAHLRQQIEFLETKLEELKCVRNETRAAETPEVVTRSSALVLTTSSELQKKSHERHTEQDVQELLQLIKTYQHEQLCLHNAIQHHEKLAVALSQTIAESKSLNFANTSIYSGMRQRDESFLWVNSVLPFLPVFSKSQVSDLVRESYLDIVRHFEIADGLSSPTDDLFDWSVWRSVTDGWVDFMFSKDFPHESVESAAASTLALLSTPTIYTEDYNAADTVIKVLEKLNDDTFIMAKNRMCATEKCWTCSIFVVIRIKTESGYIVGCRTITPLSQFESRFGQALGAERSYAVPFFAFEFTPLQSNQVDEVDQHVLGRGFRTRLGGRTGDGSDVMARSYSVMILFKILLWENVCVKPRRYLIPE